MATTSIWRVNGWLGKVLIYIENPDKTENPAAYEKQGMDGKEAQGLSDVIEYAVQQKKTGKIAVDDEDVPVMQRFVSGVNCSPTTARDEMIAVKKRFGKEEGTVAYHGYQSFAPGEATPEMAHEIGLKLAKALWGEKYQVLVATHLDKAHHLHNHFVVNTVSFLDGIKYHRTEKDYFDMQRESDRLCREYGLSVIENPKRGKSKHYGEWRAEQEGRPTYLSLIKADVDAAIRQSMTERQFFYRLRQMGYDIKVGKDITVRPYDRPHGRKLVRNLGEDYSLENIRKRILAQRRPQRVETPEPRRCRLLGDLKQARKVTGFRALYFHYCYLLGVFPQKQKINAFRTLTTESLAVFIPFKVQEIQDKGGIYFGENAISHNLIMCNKANLLNQSAFYLGVPGAGKSFAVKELIAFLMLHPNYANDEILICDPEGEFGALVKALGREKATVAHLVAGGKDKLNSMYMVEGYGEQNPIVEKSQFVMSLIEQIDKRGVGPQHKSIIDRCTALVYPEAEKEGRAATLCDLRNKLLEQPEEKAKEIALSLELYTTGSLDIFGRDSTVDLNKPYVVFDIHGLGEQLKPAGSLVITDTILNRVTLNWKRGKRTHVFIDEFHVMFENEQSGIFFNSAWRQFRKRGAYPTAITQNVEYLLDSVQASTMLSNSEFIVMLNQAASDREKLSKLLNISKEQMSYVTNADAGCGLIRYGSALVPFVNRFPRNTKLYALMTTKPGEGVFGGEEVLV